MKTYTKYLTEYSHEGKTYGCEIFAENSEQAEKQLESKRKTEKIVGFIPPDCTDCEYEVEIKA